MWLLYISLSFADEDIHVVEAEKIVEITGPAVWMTEGRYRRYVSESRKLASCDESLDKAIDEGILANERALKARDIAHTEFDRSEKLLESLVQDNADLGAKLDQERLANSRIRAQRNVAWAISGGFLAASAAATAIAVSR